MVMDKSAADAYVYAKMSGMLAKSYIGSRAVNLFDVHSLSELWSLLFTSPVPVVPEMLLAKQLEIEAANRFISEYKELLSYYPHPSDILVAFLHYFDYDNIKNIGAALCYKEKDRPDILDISPYNLINYNKWPDIAAMTASKPFSWYNRVPQVFEQQYNDYRLDCQYVTEVWKACKKVKSSCRSDLVSLIREKIQMDNILWVLRLKKYYNMPADLIVENLAYSDSEKKDKTDILVSPAMKIIDWELDDWNVWKNWKHASLLNPHTEGIVWNVDPRWVYNSYKKVYVYKAKRLFHQYPFTECPLLCWYILKQNELDNIRTASESLRLSIPASQAMSDAGVLEVDND